MYKLIGSTLLVAMVSVLTTIEPTTTTGGRIWKCESKFSKYTDTECEMNTDKTGCYHLDGFKEYKNCADICNDVEEDSIDEERCNADCSDYLSHDGNCTLVLEVDTITTAEISTTPTTTHTSTNAATPNTTVTCNCDETTKGSKSYSSSHFNGAVAGSFVGGLVTGVLVVVALVVWICHKKQGVAEKLIDAIKLPVADHATLTAKMKGYVALWYLANSCPFRLVSEQFGLAKSTIHEIVTEFMTAVISKLRSTTHLPHEGNPASPMPGCVGYVDGTHNILLKRPVKEPDLCYDRKQNFSLNVLSVATDNLEIVYYYIGAFGSAHDKRVYRCSQLPEKLPSLPANLFILGDSAYPCTTRLLPPVPFPKTAAEIKFNTTHKSMRVKVENSSGRLKGQWRRLNHMDVNSKERAVSVIECCILIHNFAIRCCTPPTHVERAVVEGGGYDIEVDTTPAGTAKRTAIANSL